jgi:hypothetical protein
VRTSALDHKVLDRAVDDASFVVERDLGDVREAVFARRECTEAGTMSEGVAILE